MGIWSSIRKWGSPPKGKDPDFMIIGVQKAGTSTLFQVLGNHPQIQLPSKKEIHFFDLFHHLGPSWYREHFKGLKGKTGEASPYYIYHPLASTRIKKYFEGRKLPKFILLLRNPIDRAYSQYQMEFDRGNLGGLSFEEALDKEPEQLKIGFETIHEHPEEHPKAHQEWSFVDRGKYHSQIVEWEKVLGSEGLLILKSEDLFSDPESTMNRVFEHLDIQPMKILNLPTINQGKGSNPMAPETRDRLRSAFRDEVKLLKERTGISWDEFDQ